MTDQKYMRPGVGFAIGKLVEELGELQAALGKTIRWGPSSVNPELPPAEQETNAAWVEREIEDVLGAIWNYRREVAAAALATEEKLLGADEQAKGAPISDWSWWVGSDETVSEEGLYDLYEAGTRDDAIGWAECHVAEGERFHIIEARTRALQGDDEFMPFVDRRNAMSFEVNSEGVAIEVASNG